MSKQKKFSKIMTYGLFFVCVGLLAAACILIQPRVLSKAKADEQDRLRKNLTGVLPLFDNEPWSEVFKIENVKIYPARHEEKVSLPGDSTGLPDHESQTVSANVLKGFAFEVPMSDSEGNNAVWVGLDMEGEITGFRPAYFREARVPENLTKTISSGTEASRIIYNAVNSGKEFFGMHKNFFYAQAHEAELSGEIR